MRALIPLGCSMDEVETLFRSEYGRLVRSLSLVAGTTEDAEDAVQEAFIEASKRWDVIGDYDDPVGWVRRVAINRIHKQHRGLARMRRAVARLPRDRHVDAPREPWSLAPQLAALSIGQRTALVLHYYEGLKVSEIADAMDVSEGTVKQHLSRARDRLAPALEGLR